MYTYTYTIYMYVCVCMYVCMYGTYVRKHVCVYTRGNTIKFANSPPCACRGSTEQKPYYGLITLTYQRFTAFLLLKYGNLLLSGIYYGLHVSWCAAARMSELELE